MIEETKEYLNLVHMHRPRLGTSLASVIGYVKTLRNRWKKIQAVYIDHTNDDRFWTLALAVYAAEQAQPPPSRPIARVI